MIMFINPIALILWVAVSYFIALIGRNRRFGFFGTFLVSLLLSPLVGILVVLASAPVRSGRRRGKRA